ncbi:MAG: hypothetical protein WDN28_03840 [Chthoniobacter sp.]
MLNENVLRWTIKNRKKLSPRSTKRAFAVHIESRFAFPIAAFKLLSLPQIQ